MCAMPNPSGGVSNAPSAGLGEQRVGPSSLSHRLWENLPGMSLYTCKLHAPACAHHGRPHVEAWLKPANQTMTLTFNIN